MDQEPKIHFHIHWSKKNRLDWEGFDTRHEATARALEFSKPGEHFTIDEISSPCPVCGPKAASAN
jgi:hypothetical protein